MEFHDTTSINLFTNFNIMFMSFPSKFKAFQLFSLPCPLDPGIDGTELSPADESVWSSISLEMAMAGSCNDFCG